MHDVFLLVSERRCPPKLGKKVCQHLLLQQRVKGLTHDHISTLVFNGADFNLEFPKGSPWRVTGERAAFLPDHMNVYSWNLSTPTPHTSISAPSPKTIQKLCRRHRTPGSGDQEHERPRIFEHEMTTEEEIEARTPPSSVSCTSPASRRPRSTRRFRHPVRGLEKQDSKL